MLKVITRVSLLTILAALVWACDHAPAPKVTPQGSAPSAAPAQPSLPAPQGGSATIAPAAAQSGEVAFKAPDGWVAEQPSSSMRVAQYRLPRADGDTEDAEAIVFYFGSGQGGSAQANLERWTGQMQQPDGRPSSEVAKTERLTVNSMNATLLDVTGLYNAEMTPGSGQRHNKPNARLRAAVIETPKGSYFVKLVGPLNTVNRWDQSFVAFVKSFSFKP